MLDVFVFQFVVGQVSGQILVVSGHIYEAVSGQVEQDDFFFSALLARLGFVDGGSDGMAGFRCRNDAFGLGEQAARVEGFQLLDVGGLHQSVFQELGDDDTRAVVTQSARMDVGRSEVVSQGEHRQEGSSPLRLRSRIGNVHASVSGTMPVRLRCNVSFSLP